MRSYADKERDRASFLTPPYEEQPSVLLAQAIRELCETIDDAAELIVAALKTTPQTASDAHERRLPNTEEMLKMLGR